MVPNKRWLLRGGPLGEGSPGKPRFAMSLKWHHEGPGERQSLQGAVFWGTPAAPGSRKLGEIKARFFMHLKPALVQASVPAEGPRPCRRRTTGRAERMCSAGGWPSCSLRGQRAGPPHPAPLTGLASPLPAPKAAPTNGGGSV